MEWLEAIQRYLYNGRSQTNLEPAMRWEIDLIRKSQLFDETWYRARTGVLDDPIEHYVRYWQDFRLEPHPLFDTEFYVAQLGEEEIAASRLTPLGHFIEFGGPADRSPHPLFDAQWYRQANKRGVGRDRIAFRDYLLRGHRKLLSPHPLFDPHWYSQQVPEIEKNGINPLTHFVELGAIEGINPNRYFDTRWYSSAYHSLINADPVSCKRNHINPLVHFIHHVESKKLSPSPSFDIGFYRRVISNAPADDLSAFKQFLIRDRVQYEGALTRERHSPSIFEGFGRRNVLGCHFSSSVETAKRLILFAIHQVNPEFELHQELIMAGFPKHEFEFVVVRSEPSHSEEFLAMCKARGISGIVRDDHGRDFASWIVALFHLSDWLDRYESITLLNDSVYGPVGDNMRHLLQRLTSSDASCIAITDSYEQGLHLQSYFLHLRSDIVRHDAFQRFVRSYSMPTEKRDVIRQGELGLSRVIMGLGKRIEVLAPYEEVVKAWLADYHEGQKIYRRLLEVEGGTFLADGYAEYGSSHMSSVLKKVALGEPVNPTHYFWDTLIRHFGCPFVKRELVNENPCGVPNLHLLADFASTELLQCITAKLRRANSGRAPVPSFSPIML